MNSEGDEETLPACAVLLDLEGVHFGLPGRDRTLGDSGHAVVDTVVEHSDAVPVNRGAVDGKVRRKLITHENWPDDLPIDPEVVSDRHADSIAPISPDCRAGKGACPVHVRRPGT